MAGWMMAGWVSLRESGCVVGVGLGLPGRWESDGTCVYGSIMTFVQN